MSLKYKRLPMVPLCTPGWIYVVRAAGTNRFKVGFTRRDPMSRMKELQAYSPLKLELFGAAWAKFSDEKRWHKEFAAFASHGEWYVIPEEVLRLLAFSVDDETAARMDRQVQWYVPGGVA